MVEPIFHDFDDSVFIGLAGRKWELRFRVYSRMSEAEQVHMSHEENVLPETAEYMFTGWFVVRPVDKREGPFAVDERNTFILRINTKKFPIGKTLRIGDKIEKMDDRTIYRIKTKAIYDAWSGVNRFICDEFT